MISRGLIEYPSRRNTYYGEDDKGLPNRSQAKNSGEPNPDKKETGCKANDVDNPHEVYLRIKQEYVAKGITTDKGIAEQVGVKGSSVVDWKKSGQIKRENLKKIVDFTGRTADWLLWGTGETPAQDEGDTRIEFSDSEQVFITQLANSEKVSYEAMVYRLVVEALKSRSAVLFSDYKKLPTEQLDDVLPYVLPAKKR